MDLLPRRNGAMLIGRSRAVNSIVSPCDSFDLILSAFTFDNIPLAEHRLRLLAGLRERLKSNGILVLVGSTPEMYTHDWASFSTTQFPENARARSGHVVRCVITDIEDRRPAEDVFWTDEDYHSLFAGAGLSLVACHRPLATGGEPYAWVNETQVAPWVIYATTRAETGVDHVDPPHEATASTSP